MDQQTLQRDYAPMYILRSGVMVYIPTSAVGVEWPETVVVAGLYAGTDEFNIVADVPRAPLEHWDAREVAIQDAFPEMSVADRLFIQCGSKARVYEP